MLLGCGFVIRLAKIVIANLSLSLSINVVIVVFVVDDIVIP